MFLVAPIFGNDQSFEQFVIGRGHLVGAGSVVIANGDGSLTARLSRIKIENGDAHETITLLRSDSSAPLSDPHRP